MRNIPLILALTTGCSFDEPFTHYDISGVVKLPVDAAKFEYVYEDGSTEVINDPRAIGPVYIGAFPSVRTGDFEYPHPEMGPVITDARPGDTYAYGATSIGRPTWGCYESTICNIVTGRFSGYDDVLDFFNNTLAPLDPETEPNPLEVLDENQQTVTDPTAYQERCYEVLDLTSDVEVDFVPPEQNEEAIGEYLDFELDGDYYVAEIELLDVKFVEGMAIWGWVDMPAATSFGFASCDTTLGDEIVYYTEDYFVGSAVIDLINYPSLYIDAGDWVVDEWDEIDDPEAEFEIILGHEYDG